jgi:hypothetical protein
MQPDESGDPRKLGGGIAGPGGPHDQGAVVIDTRKAVLLDTTNVAMVDNKSDGRRIAALLLGGRVNRSPDSTSVLYLLNADGAAAIVSELIALAGRESGQWAADFSTALTERMEAMP